VNGNGKPKPARRPVPIVLEGRYTRLEPLAPVHAEALLAATGGEGAAERYRWLSEYPPDSREALAGWIRAVNGNEDRVPFAVVDRTTGLCGGRQSLMRIVPEHGVVELGGVLWGRGVARTRLATEAVFLTARHVFEALGYRRLEWKCDALNEASRRAALRFGFVFEGIFRQHMIVKGENRDTAWFATLDGDWPRLKAGYERWLEPGNFDSTGLQKRPLSFD
jgi:RimJ/RimL family protein N-acetyltransferase